jgi:H+-transporting ATPase
MVTGDNVAIAREVSRELGLGDHILTVKNGEPAKELDSADGFAQVFPVNKYSIVRGLQSRGHIVGMTGDGVNDAPALRQADLGIAVSGAADAARAAASIVLTAPGLSVIVGAIEMARQIFERMTTYAIYRIAETVRIMLFMVLSIMIYHFYPITVLMMILLAVLNDVPIMAIAYDNTVLPPKPVRWDLRRVISTAGALGVIGVLSSFLLLVLCDTVLHIDPQHIQSIIFLKLSVAGHMTLFVVRSRSAFWSPPYPAPTLLGAILFTQFLATLLVWSGIFVPSIPLTHIALIWVYASVWMVFADVVKRGVYRYLGKSPEIATIP